MASSQKEVNARCKRHQTEPQHLEIKNTERKIKNQGVPYNVLPLLLHGTECPLFTKHQKAKLERWQKKPLWKIATSRSDFGKRRPASDQLREMCQCPTIASVIRQRRLALWKSVLTPF